MIGTSRLPSHKRLQAPPTSAEQLLNLRPIYLAVEIPISLETFGQGTDKLCQRMEPANGKCSTIRPLSHTGHDASTPPEGNSWKNGQKRIEQESESIGMSA